MPDRTQKTLVNGDRVAIYKPMRGLTKKDRERHQALIDNANRRSQKRQWKDKQPRKKVDWLYWGIMALVIIL
jgi:hypothetical protein